MDELKEKLIQANAVFKKFFHDARTSLTVIGGYVSVMLDGDAGEISPEQRDYLNIINKSVGKVQGVMEEVSEFLLLWAGHIIPKKATVDLKSIILNSIKNIDDAARKKGITIDCEINLKESPVFADSAVMSKALFYLLNDYVKLLPASSRVRVSLVSRGEDFYITFRDNVLEMAPDLIPLVFQGFYQNEKASSEDDRELGLGFPIAKTIIEMHEGKIWMEADPAGKTFISFAFPRRKEEDRAKVLIVEDNEFIARLWADKLRKAEYTVVLATSARDLKL
ncbi:MAG: ATP-binding protein [Firmicutes bacterium]|nr:ATP-binding protein [Bacillota bacterium]